MNSRTAAILARKAALAASAATYTGQPCNLGHVTRYTANRLCVECAKARRAIQTDKARLLRQTQGVLSHS